MLSHSRHVQLVPEVDDARIEAYVVVSIDFVREAM